MGKRKSRVLFWHDFSTYADIIRWIRYFDLLPIVVDTEEAFKRGSGRRHVVSSLQEALSEFNSYRWVFLDHRGSAVLDEFEHPSKPTVYAFGEAVTGFDMDASELPGDVVRLRVEEETHARFVLPLVLYDRALFLAGRRR